MSNASKQKMEYVTAAASKAQVNAYAPYSNFKMGAAVLCSNGDVVTGALVENVSLGLAMCAERVALFSAITSGLNQVDVLALVAPRTDGNLTWPCGACLQVATELTKSDLLVIASDGRITETALLHELAPRMPRKS